jgi:acylglycerol lipase
MSVIHHTEETFEGKYGTRLFDQSWTPEGKTRTTLIMLHGLHDHSGRYDWAAHELAKQGYSVYGFDLRGHGRSAGRPQWVDSFDDYIEDLGLFVKLVRSRESERPLYIFGFSMDGCIVASYALNGVILAGPALKPPSDTSYLSISSVKLIAALLPSLGVFRPASRDYSRDEKVVAEMEADPLISKGRIPARTMAGLLQAGERLLAKAESFDIPFLAMQGTADKLVDPKGTRAFYDRSHSADKRLKFYENFYHDILHEPGKENVVKDILDWLRERS